MLAGFNPGIPVSEGKMIRDKQRKFGSVVFIAATLCSLLLLPLLKPVYAGEADSSLSTEVTSNDGTPMVLVPAGEFIMGSVAAPRVRQNEEPQHTVYLDAFYIDKYEVTNALYNTYVDANGGGTVEPAYIPSNQRLVDMSIHGDVPVSAILWKSAKGYCEWVGKRLPTEAEWEKAARGTDGRLYPWGNDLPTDELAVFGVRPQHWGGPRSFSRVDSHAKGASPYGAHHMAGNVFEWVNDIYMDQYYEETPLRNPQGPPRGTMNRHGKKLDSYIVRGGSAKSNPIVLKAAFRAGWSHIYTPPHGGFRCAKNVGDDGTTDSYAGGVE